MFPKRTKNAPEDNKITSLERLFWKNLGISPRTMLTDSRHGNKTLGQIGSVRTWSQSKDCIKIRPSGHRVNPVIWVKVSSPCQSGHSGEDRSMFSTGSPGHLCQTKSPKMIRFQHIPIIPPLLSKVQYMKPKHKVSMRLEVSGEYTKLEKRIKGENSSGVQSSLSSR